MKNAILLILCCLGTTSFAARPKDHYIKIETVKGTCIIKLYNETPLHRNNFIKLAKKGRLDGTLFHRVISNFMIQGGNLDSRDAKRGILLGEGDVGYTIPAEFRDSLFHKKGVLAAARDDNPEKASSGSQFYIVQGRKFTDEQLDEIETNRLKTQIPKWQREVYKQIGGTPHLDKNYTVYGEVVKGLEMVDNISTIATDSNNRPLADITMTVSILKRREARKLEKELNKTSTITQSYISQ